MDFNLCKGDKPPWEFPLPVLQHVGLQCKWSCSVVYVVGQNTFPPVIYKWISSAPILLQKHISCQAGVFTEDSTILVFITSLFLT